MCHYKVKDLTIRAIESFRKFYPDMQLTVIDGSSFDESTEWLFDFAKQDKRTSIYSHNWNVHHGPSMHLGIVGSEYDNVFIFESDVTVLRGGFIEAMLERAGDKPFYSIGRTLYVDRNGINTPEGMGIPYIHPFSMIVNKKVYQRFDPFIKHGAPCIKAYCDIYDKNQTELLIDFDIREYVKHDWRGTRDKYGLNI